MSGGLADPRLLDVIAQSGLMCVLMHWRGPSAGMSRLAVYDDVVAQVVEELSARSRSRC